MVRGSRRQFLEASMFAAVSAMGTSGGRQRVFAQEAARSVSSAETLGVAVVGVRNRGGAHIGAFTSRKDTEILWIVDVDRDVAEAKAFDVAKRQKRKPAITQDMRKAFEDPAVDIVSIATPNHWHALASIWAMQHGKDVYVEKPVSHNVTEGRRIVEAARKYGRICQTGTQARSMSGVRSAMQFLHEGGIGKTQLARGICYKTRNSIGAAGAFPAPPSVNYDLWLGPAPQSPVTRSQFHYDWHWQWAYGNGDLGNQGIHQMDIARWGLQLQSLSNAVLSYGGRLGYKDAGETPNTQVVIHDYGDKSLVFEVRGLKTPPYRGATTGVVFEGTEGNMVVSRYDAAAFDNKDQIVRKFSGGDEASHYDNFVAAVRSRDISSLNADILEGHLSSALCHLGNISYQLGKHVESGEARAFLSTLKTSDNNLDTLDRTCQHLNQNGVDPSRLKIQLGPWLTIESGKEKFFNNSAADALLSREYREPFAVPGPGQI